MRELLEKIKSLKIKWWKLVGGVAGATVAGFLLMITATKVVYPAISQVVGLSVAQSATLWNNVIDASKGDAQASGILGMSPFLYNGATFDRVRGDILNGMDVDVTRIGGSLTPSDGFTNPTTVSNVWSLESIWNGATWDRIRGISATNNTATTSLGAIQVTPLSTWSVTNTVSAAVTAASASKATGGGTVRHVATGVTLCYSDTAIAGVSLVHLRDGATGAGTILRTWMISVPVAGEARCENVTGLNMTGSANTAMTLEFAAATAATSSKTVTLTGYSTP